MTGTTVLASMTRMSEPGACAARRIEDNQLESLAGSPLARGLHVGGARVLVLPLLLLIGCVIPPNLSVENQDAGVNSPPAILSVRSDLQDLPEPGPPVVFERGSGNLLVELLDTDLGDTLYVRVFVGYRYDDPSPARAACTAKPSDTAKRTCTADLVALCREGDVGSTQDMNVAVFDRELLDSGTPPFRAMDEGGLTTGRYYKLNCQDPPS